MEDYKNILVIRMSSLGDIIHTLPTLYALRKNWPQARIVWAVHPQFKPVLPGKPYIDEIVCVEERRLLYPPYWYTLRKRLHSYHFDLSLDLQGWAKSAVVALCSGATRRVGYGELAEGSRLVSTMLTGPHCHGNLVERYLDTVRALGGTTDTVAFPLPDLGAATQATAAVMQQDGIGETYVVAVPGARWALKEWPLPQWRKLLRRITAQGMPVVLLGSKADGPKGEYLRREVPSPYLRDYIGKTTILEMMAIIRGASLFISADTGPLHAANALQRPLIALFGTTGAARSAPYHGGDKQHIQVLISPTARADARHPKIKDPDCMRQITVDRVWEAYEQSRRKFRF